MKRSDATAAVRTEPGVEGTDLDAALALAIGQLRAVWHRRMRALDLSPPQGITLKMLSESPLPMRAIADVLTCDASNMTGIADRLEERGLVERTTDATDRRVKLLQLTDAGRSVLASIDAPLSSEISGLAVLADAERSQLAILLHRAFG
jgi:DNA-binding MarR family transcriptional regulator